MQQSLLCKHFSISLLGWRQSTVCSPGNSVSQTAQDEWPPEWRTPSLRPSVCPLTRKCQSHNSGIPPNSISAPTRQLSLPAQNCEGGRQQNGSSAMALRVTLYILVLSPISTLAAAKCCKILSSSVFQFGLRSDLLHLI